MGSTTTTHVSYSCDMCHLPIAERYRSEPRILWQDRDVTARTKVSVTIEIDYRPEATVLCRPCAARLMRIEAEKIDPLPQQRDA